jgi:hypothetical protein
MSALKRWVGFFLLELYAFILALSQYLHGVKTDEAKYLLNIPYPHPPLARFLLHLTDSWSFQEFFWRFLFASLCVLAVVFVWKLAHDLKFPVRLALAVLWLFNSAIIFQAGSIMMAPLTALQAWVFVYLFLRDEESHENGGVIALFWLASLFTAYQAVLFAPIVWVLLRRSTGNLRWHPLYFCLPLALLCLYTLTNPLVLASMLIHTDHSSIGFFAKVREFLDVWFLGGSIVLSVVGFVGIVRNKIWPVLCSFLLVAAYVWLARFGYYAILFLPLSMAGVITMFRKRQISPLFVASGVIACSLYLFIHSLPLPNVRTARTVMQVMQEKQVTGPILIKGNFGHEWEYESRVPILRYNSALLPLATGLVCLDACPEMEGLPNWRIHHANPTVYLQWP